MEEAFAAFTRGGAFAAFAEDRLGTLEQGRFADFIFIDRDIFANLDQRAVRETRVLETYVAGRRVWSRENAAGGADPVRERVRGEWFCFLPAFWSLGAGPACTGAGVRFPAHYVEPPRHGLGSMIDSSNILKARGIKTIGPSITGRTMSLYYQDPAGRSGSLSARVCAGCHQLSGLRQSSGEYIGSPVRPLPGRSCISQGFDHRAGGQGSPRHRRLNCSIAR